MQFKNVTGKNKVIYEGMWGKFEFPEVLKIEPTSNGKSTTYKIAGEPGVNGETIQKAFSINNKELFENQYHKVVSGNGDEAKKILTLHSSSRCAILCFYHIDSTHTVTLNLNGRDVEFNFSTFEFKNPVIGYPSNMDVVLVSSDRKVVLFLESKFSEYYINATKHSAHISKSYEEYEFSKQFYTSEMLNFLEIRKEYVTVTKKDKGGEEKQQEVMVLFSMDDSEIYLDGFKQMISHYVGVRRRLSGACIKSDVENDIATTILDVIKKPDSKVYLGEILFDTFTIPNDCNDELHPKKMLEKYSELYHKLAKAMNQQIKLDGIQDKFEVLPFDLKYSEFMRCNPHIEPATLSFYGIKE